MRNPVDSLAHFRVVLVAAGSVRGGDWRESACHSRSTANTPASGPRRRAPRGSRSRRCGRRASPRRPCGIRRETTRRRATAPVATPHDSLFRNTFAQPEHAAPLLRALLPAPLVAAIDRSGDEEWSEREDLNFRPPAPHAFLALPPASCGAAGKRTDWCANPRTGRRLRAGGESRKASRWIAGRCAGSW